MIEIVLLIITILVIIIGINTRIIIDNQHELAKALEKMILNQKKIYRKIESREK